MSALLAPANPHRIKATHRRRRKVASGRFVQRYYDAEIGRFISPDPVGPEEDFVNHFNRYNYAQNNPVRYTDPDGEEPTHRNGPAKLKNGTTAPFKTLRQAGKAAIGRHNADSKKNNKEIGGKLFKAKDGTFGIAKAVEGDSTGVDVGKSPIPTNAKEAGNYHTHGDYGVNDGNGGSKATGNPAQDDFGADNFSDTDEKLADNKAKVIEGYKAYLGNPDGQTKEYDPSTKQTVVVDDKEKKK